MLERIPHKYGLLYPDDALRAFAMHVCADIGSGKSSLLGRIIAFLDFLRGVPTIILDKGDAIDNFLHKFLKLPKELREAWWHRIVYVPLGGLDGFVVPIPLYYHLGKEDPLIISQRFVDAIIRMTPALQTAQIMGEGPIRDIAETMGVELVNRGWQLSELDKLTKKIPASLRVKMIPFMYSDIQRAIYCASLPGINLNEVITKQQIVLLDYRGIENPQFALSWVLDYFFKFITYRGTYEAPISIIIDEMFALKRAQRIANEEFFAYWQEILKDTMRHHNLWLVLAHQYMGQFDGEMQDLLLSITTQIIGKTLSMKTARVLSQQLADIDTNKVKATTPIYGSVQTVAGGRIYDPLFDSYTNTPGITDHFMIDERDIFSPAHEQYIETSKRFKKIKPLEFEVHIHQQEPVRYSLLGTENDIDIINPETRQILSAVRKKLVERDGRKVEDVLEEIAQRTQAPPLKQVAETPATYAQKPADFPWKEPL